MTSSSDKPISAIQISPASARVLEASIAAGTSGPVFWLLQGTITVLVAAVFVASIGVALYSGAAALRQQAGALEMLGFATFFAIPFGIFLAFQAQFLRRLLQRPRG